MKNRLCIFICTLLIAGCATSPAYYGDESGFMGLGFIAKKTVTITYDGPLRPLHETGIIALDSRLTIRSIRTPNGEIVNTRKVTKGGLGIINTPNDEQLHFLPGTYILSFCFFINVNQGTMFCKTPLDTPVTISKNEVAQLSWSGAKNGGWTVIRQEISDEIRQRITSDFSEVITTAKSTP
jgi:hypothetical protein